MAQTTLGIDIGSYSIKICEIRRLLREFEVIHFSEHILEQGSRLTHEELVASALRGILEKNEILPETVAVSLPAHLLSCRILDLPFTNIKKIEQTLEFELESHIPVSLDELLVDYHIISIGEAHSTVLAAYVPRARFVKYLEMLKMAGIDPKYVGVDSIDISNVAQVAMVPQEAVYAILDIGHSKTNICVMKGEKLNYVRSIGIGGVHFTRAIQKAFKLNYEKAEGLKLDRGKVSARDDDLDQISRLCQKVADELCVGIRQTYLGYRQIYPDRDWAALYVTGGGSRLTGLIEMISSALRLNVATLDCLDFISHRIKQPEKARDTIATALAQTLRVIFSNKAVKINFRRGEFAYRRDFKALGSEIRQVGIWMAAVLVLGISHFFFSYTTLNSRIDRASQGLVQAAVKSLPEFKNQKEKGAKQLLNIIGSKLAEIGPQLKALSGAESGPLTYLLEISQKVPVTAEVPLDVDDFTYTGDHIRLEGRTNSFEGVDKIKGAIAASPLFKNVTSENVVKGLKDEVKFSVSMDLAEGK
ncbi:MAG: pilus assembly protein PilM [Deltaproteobacteria bacterium]|nr:pilus assembly protein PilM [Deltaproteobacteria bacterium]